MCCGLWQTVSHIVVVGNVGEPKFVSMSLHVASSLVINFVGGGLRGSPEAEGVGF